MEIINKYPKLFQWIFLLAVFFGLCFAIDVPEGYKFIRAQAEYRIVEGQTQYTFLGIDVAYFYFNILWRLPPWLGWLPIWVNDSLHFLLNDWMPMEFWDEDIQEYKTRPLVLQITRVISGTMLFFIEFIRAVPLITILFMASFVLPLFLESGTNFDKLLRALIGIALFQAAYFAEVVRGGLQAIPKGQYEAADAVGLSYFQKNALIILPQALKISIPNIVGSSISLFKDTTLVLIIGLMDMLAMVNMTSQDIYWLGRETEGYVFVTIVFWVILYSMSRYSRKLEIRFNLSLIHI